MSQSSKNTEQLTIDRVVRLVNGSRVVATVTVLHTYGSEAVAVTADGCRYRVYRADLFVDRGRLYCSGFQSLGCAETCSGCHYSHDYSA